jgi:hypothetical protein
LPFLLLQDMLAAILAAAKKQSKKGSLYVPDHIKLPLQSFSLWKAKWMIAHGF